MARLFNSALKTAPTPSDQSDGGQDQNDGGQDLNYGGQDLTLIGIIVCSIFSGVWGLILGAAGAYFLAGGRSCL